MEAAGNLNHQQLQPSTQPLASAGGGQPPSSINAATDPQASTVPPIVEERVVKNNGDTQVKRYIKGKFLGKGGFAKCYEFTS